MNKEARKPLCLLRETAGESDCVLRKDVVFLQSERTVAYRAAARIFSVATIIFVKLSCCFVMSDLNISI